MLDDLVTRQDFFTGVFAIWCLMLSVITNGDGWVHTAFLLVSGGMIGSLWMGVFFPKQPSPPE